MYDKYFHGFHQWHLIYCGKKLQIKGTAYYCVVLATEELSNFLTYFTCSLFYICNPVLSVCHWQFNYRRSILFKIEYFVPFHVWFDTPCQRPHDYRQSMTAQIFERWIAQSIQFSFKTRTAHNSYANNRKLDSVLSLRIRNGCGLTIFINSVSVPWILLYIMRHLLHVNALSNGVCIKIMNVLCATIQ